MTRTIVHCIPAAVGRFARAINAARRQDCFEILRRIFTPPNPPEDRALTVA